MSHTSTDIDDLLRRYHTNDSIIIEAMVERYHSLLYRLAYSILDDAVEADDAVQDAFINAALHMERYKLGTNFKAWLLSITVNVCRGYLRKRNTRKNLETLLKTLHLDTAKPINPEQSALENEFGSQLWAAVGRLGEKYRLVVVLRVIHQLPVTEIACILGINEKTIYTRLYEAFRNLRKQLKSSSDFV